MVTKMKRIVNFLYKAAGVFCLLLMFSCEKADILVPTTGNEVTGIRIMMPDGSNVDFAVTPDENNIINLEVDGSIQTDLTKIRMSVNIPNNAMIESQTPMGEYMDFSKNVTFDVIAANGDKKSYTIKLKVIPTEIEIQELWSKSATDLNFVKHNNGALAISDNYLVIHERTKFDYYNINDGTKVGTMSFEGIDWSSLTRTVPLFMTNDDAGNIVATNFYMSRWMPTGGNNIIHMFWWKGVTAKPELLFSYDVDLEDLPGNKDVGRKIYVKGDISKHAFLYMGVSFQNMFLRWEIKEGKVVSEQPKKIAFDPGYQMGVLNTIVPVEFGENSNYFISRYDKGAAKVAFTYMDGTTNTPLYKSEHHIQDVFHQWLGGGASFDYLDLKGARYIFIIEQNIYNWMKEVYNVRKLMKDPKTTGTNPLDYVLPKTRVWNNWTGVDPNYGSNGNLTADVKIKILDDGKSAWVAFLCTNTGVTVWKVRLK